MNSTESVFVEHGICDDSVMLRLLNVQSLIKSGSEDVDPLTRVVLVSSAAQSFCSRDSFMEMVGASCGVAGLRTVNEKE